MTAVEDLSQADKILQKILELIDKYGTNPDFSSFTSLQEEIKYCNLWADFWRSVIGVNVMPEQFKELMRQDISIPDWQHVAWKNQGTYSGGIVVADNAKWLRPDKARVFRTRKGDSLVCRIDGKSLVVEKVNP